MPRSKEHDVTAETPVTKKAVRVKKTNSDNSNNVTEDIAISSNEMSHQWLAKMRDLAAAAEKKGNKLFFIIK